MAVRLNRSHLGSVTWRSVGLTMHCLRAGVLIISDTLGPVTPSGIPPSNQCELFRVANLSAHRQVVNICSILPTEGKMCHRTAIHLRQLLLLPFKQYKALVCTLCHVAESCSGAARSRTQFSCQALALQALIKSTTTRQHTTHDGTDFQCKPVQVNHSPKEVARLTIAALQSLLSQNLHP